MFSRSCRLAALVYREFQFDRMAFSPIDKDSDVAYSVQPPRGTLISSGLHNTTKANPWWKFGGHDRIFVTSRLETSGSSLSSSQDDTSVQLKNTKDGTVFSDTSVAEFYEPIEKYEGRHRFDQSATWSDEEERKLVRRVTFLRSYSSVKTLGG